MLRNWEFSSTLEIEDAHSVLQTCAKQQRINHIGLVNICSELGWVKNEITASSQNIFLKDAKAEYVAKRPEKGKNLLTFIVKDEENSSDHGYPKIPDLVDLKADEEE